MNPNNSLQAFMDGMSAQWQRERSASQMTLGKLIDRLNTMPPAAEIDGIENPHSYRGYYSDLAFEKAKGRVTVEEAIGICHACMEKVFTGYKGGDFQMGRTTPIWIADYGNTGLKIMALRNDGTFELATDEY